MARILATEGAGRVLDVARVVVEVVVLPVVLPVLQVGEVVVGIDAQLRVRRVDLGLGLGRPEVGHAVPVGVDAGLGLGDRGLDLRVLAGPLDGPNATGVVIFHDPLLEDSILSRRQKGGGSSSRVCWLLPPAAQPCAGAAAHGSSPGPDACCCLRGAKADFPISSAVTS